jgi:hypothetical protein
MYEMNALTYLAVKIQLVNIAIQSVSFQHIEEFEINWEERVALILHNYHTSHPSYPSHHCGGRNSALSLHLRQCSENPIFCSLLHLEHLTKWMPLDSCLKVCGQLGPSWSPKPH